MFPKKVSFWNSSCLIGPEEYHQDENYEESESRSIFYQEYKLSDRYVLALLEYFNTLDDEEYVAGINQTIREKQHLILENQVFEYFLTTNEPQLLAGLPLAMNAIRDLEAKYPYLPFGFDLTDETNAGAIIFSDLGPSINLSSRYDLVLREVEEMEEKLKSFEKQSNRAKIIMNAINEESSIRIEETKESRAVFEEAMLNAIDPITNRIPAEKFVWFLDEWHKSAWRITEKLRLRNSSLKVQYRKVKATFDQKEEMGDFLYEVDFDQYRIQNKYLKQKIEQANVHLVELKNFDGKANLDLAKMKRLLQRIQNGIKSFKLKIDHNECQIIKLNRECEVAQKKLEEEICNYNVVKHLVHTCHAPDPLDYLHVKARLSDLIKEAKIISRKQNLQDITTKTTLREMLRLTGLKKTKKEWFQPHQQDKFEEIDFDLGAKTSNVFPMPTSSQHLSEFDIFTVIKCGNINEPKVPENEK